MAKTMKVEDYEKLVVETTGLVPMRFLKGTITEREGDIAGFEPYTAKRMHDEGLAEPVGDLGNAADDDTGSRDAGNDGDERRSAIVIADGWADQHHLQRKKLAKEIAGSDPDLTSEEADVVIRAELDRRGAAG